MPKKFDRCVKKVTRKGGVDNPYAICTAAVMGKKKKKHEKTRTKKSVPTGIRAYS